jgi:peptidyl-prolyl cis-trans isomerase D
VASVGERIRAGEDFAELAMAVSDDLGSAAIGGELGFTDGSAFPEPMEEAIAGLAAPGDVSDAVETDAGTHFIRLEERVVSAPPDYDRIRAELRESIQQSEADRELLLAVETLRDLVFTAPNLTQPAEELGVAPMVSSPFSEDSGEGIFSDARLRAAAFSDDVKTAGNNSEVIELSSGRFVALRLKELKPAQVAPYNEVSSDVERRLRAELETSKVESMQAEAEAQLQAGTTMEAVAQALDLDWRVELGASRVSSLLPRSILDAAFAMPDGSPHALSVVRTEDGYALVQLARVTAGSIDGLTAAESERIEARRAGDQRQLELDEFMLFQRDSANIVVR